MAEGVDNSYEAVMSQGRAGDVVTAKPKPNYSFSPFNRWSELRKRRKRRGGEEEKTEGTGTAFALFLPCPWLSN